MVVKLIYLVKDSLKFELSLPVLYLLIIISGFIEPSFWILLFIMLVFSWMSLEGVVRAEFLRARNFEYVKAAKSTWG